MPRDVKTKRYAEQTRFVGSDYATKIDTPTLDNFVSMDAAGNIKDSGYDAGSFADASAILGDATAGRRLRQVQLTIDNGTNANTLKCTVASLWSGDAIGTTDNVAKGATTGNFTLDAAGEYLIIEKAGLSGNVVMAQGTLASNPGGTAATLDCLDTANDIKLALRNSAASTLLDLTALVDVGAPIEIYILYLTDA
uniref:Uncharacterized protein n=1 Tax=viral metagenome TaxID=1070528 RepID=A0A6H1ZKS8_9ZZZZ